ncbi:MAG: glycosyltransferase, partial [Bacteroidales bacterium]|nr:glycosyltransferase [Bacteroidales bacterium]
MERKINIIALNIPYPPNYGGVIDIYYKIEALHRQGIGVILHCFEYDRPRAPQLENICLEVHYYKRKTGLLPNLSTLPYNVYGRKDPLLLENLQKNDYPILFDGLHSCYYLNHPSLRNRFKIFRECNIEHDYYRKLALSEHGLIRKSFLLLESLRFAAFQKQVKAAQLILCVSQADTAYLQKKFPENRVVFVPCFHPNREVSATPGQSDFILYHGKLSVAENEKAALYLIRNVFSKLPYRCTIAGMEPSKRLSRAAQKHANIILEADPERERM